MGILLCRALKLGLALGVALRLTLLPMVGAVPASSALNFYWCPFRGQHGPLSSPLGDGSLGYSLRELGSKVVPLRPAPIDSGAHWVLAPRLPGLATVVVAAMSGSWLTRLLMRLRPARVAATSMPGSDCLLSANVVK